MIQFRKQVACLVVCLFVCSFVLNQTHSVCELLSCRIFFGSTFAAWIGKFRRNFSAPWDVLTGVFGTFGESLKSGE